MSAENRTADLIATVPLKRLVSFGVINDVPGAFVYLKVVGSDVWRPISPPMTSLWVTPHRSNRPDRLAWSDSRLSDEVTPRTVRTTVMDVSGVPGATRGVTPGSVARKLRLNQA